MVLRSKKGIAENRTFYLIFAILLLFILILLAIVVIFVNKHSGSDGESKLPEDCLKHDEVEGFEKCVFNRFRDIENDADSIISTYNDKITEVERVNNFELAVDYLWSVGEIFQINGDCHDALRIVDRDVSLYDDESKQSYYMLSYDIALGCDDMEKANKYESLILPLKDTVKDEGEEDEENF